MRRGREDLDTAVQALCERLPDELAVLARLAYNYQWSWLPEAREVFCAVDPLRWEQCGENPVRLLQETSSSAVRRAAADRALLDRAAAAEAAIRADVERPTGASGITEDSPVAFFCAEYGVHRSLPVYSGGLGALAGDILKEASDLALPLVAVGLMYRQGYFRQRIDASGWQHEYWVDTDPDRLPAALVTRDDGLPLTVTVTIGESDVCAQIWRVQIGRVPLYLLDTARPENDRVTRWIASRLYVGDPTMRLDQYTLLGIGGMRALRAMGIEPGVVHLNEGHAAFASLALAEAEDDAVEQALEAARRRTIFTTHTPVPAGNDTYPPEQVTATLAPVARSLGLDVEELIRRGRTHPDDQGEPFGVTQFALRASRAANGVSRRHGEVAREMWQGLWADRAIDDVPIGHVTNGVHVPTWIGPHMRALMSERAGADWLSRAGEPETWAVLDDVDDETLTEVRRKQRHALVDYVRERSVLDRLSRGEPRHYVEAAAHTFDPDVLTIGFARRLATYKRLGLLLHDPVRGLRLLSGERPIQIVLAGKAHPRDDDGKRLVQQLFASKGADGFGQRVVFLDDYELGMAATLVAGCDVWINLPRPPLEASGTSGMKNVLNGGLQLSVLDGWWAEAYDGTNGWALPGELDHDHAAQDAHHASEMYRLLEQEVVPAFYERDSRGMAPAWLERMRASLRTLPAQFSATRMVRDYAEQFYADTSVRT